jgi:hypothetical protein
MAQDRLEECLQAVAGGKDPGVIERRGRMRFLKGKISERIQQRPPDLLKTLCLKTRRSSFLKF